MNNELFGEVMIISKEQLTQLLFEERRRGFVTGFVRARGGYNTVHAQSKEIQQARRAWSAQPYGGDYEELDEELEK